jgi:hypothetical protein
MATPHTTGPRDPVMDALSANDLDTTGLRLALAAELGHSGFNNRDRYDAFGWEVDPEEEEYVGLYLRNPYGGGLIDKIAQLSWRHNPEIQDTADGDDDTAFEETVGKLARSHDFWTYLSRCQRAAGFGEYALVFVDFSDTSDLDNLDAEVSLRSPDLDDIRGFRVIPQFAVDDVDHGDFGSERWGEPEFYTIDWGEDIDEDLDDTAASSKVHHSRVIEVPSKPPLTEEYSSRPRLERWLNTLYNIEKLLGSAAEMAYRGADKGLHINWDPTKVDPSSVDDDGTTTDIQEWYHGPQPTLNTVGAEVKDLGGSISDPSGALEGELKSLSAATGFSKQFIEGAAAGEIASSETNMRNDFGEIREQQQQYVGPYLVRRGLNVLLDAGVVPDPDGGDFEIEWPDLFELSDAEEADLQQTRSQTAKNLGVMGDPAQTYVEEGEFPEDEPAMPPVDESNPAVAEQFEAAATATNQDADDIDLTPPESAQNNAQKVLDWRADDDKDVQGMTDTGWGTARTLASGDELSPEKVQQIAAWFARHGPEEAEVPEDTDPWRDNGRVANLGWGGETMRDWVQGKRRRLAEMDILDPVANADYGFGDILTGNATRYSEGDTVSTPQGVGVVLAVATAPIESEEVDDVDASEDSPTYMVAVEDGRVGSGFYKAGELHSTDITTDLDDPVGEMAGDQSANAVLQAITNTLTSNDFSPPRSWRQSETPARIIGLKVLAEFKDFDGCVREMRGDIRSPDRFCGSFFDWILGNPYWRGDSPLPGD